ncbi:mechanosensitive ion channel family protein [Ammoniphilus resinae]|nr:mechanosensitive ion channel family protein [Ammoniphilus resinae]
MGIYEQVTNTDLWMTVGQAIFKIIFIIIIARILVNLVSNSVNRIFRKREKLQLNERRVETMRSLVNNVTSYVIYFVAILLILAQFGFNLGPVLASAGVVGLAVGFGAQNLVRDVITGFFIIFEDQFAVGDYIQTGQFFGEVKEIGLRITKIKGYTGEIFIIPNGSITEVTNFSIQNSLAVLDVRVAYEEDVDQVIEILNQSLKDAPTIIEDIIATPEVVGVQDLGPSEVLIRVTAECKPMAHFAANRKLRSLVKKIFEEKGIEIPYPRLVTMPQKDMKNFL